MDFPWKKKKNNSVLVHEETFAASPKVHDETVLSSGSPRKASRAVSSPKPQEKKRKQAHVQQDLLDVLQEETVTAATSAQSATPAASSRWANLRTSISKLLQGREQTILEVTSPLQESELESLRVQTLVDFSASATISWPGLPNEQALWQGKAQDFLKLLNGIASHHLGKEQNQVVTQLKNAIVVRSKLLAQPEIILNIINQGLRSYHHTLDRLAQVTSYKKCNKKIWEYLHHLSENHLVGHGDEFRKALDKCIHYDALETLLLQYPLASVSTIKHYQALQIIRAVKQIKLSYDRSPQNLMHIMNKYLGAHGEVPAKEKLSKLLVTSALDAEILQKIQKERTLTGIVQALAKAAAGTQATAYTEKLYQVVRTFADPQYKVSFADFKIGLNAFSPALISKISNVSRESIQEELRKEVGRILSAKTSPVLRLENLDETLTNPRYQETFIKIYGYPPQVLHEKIHAIPGHTPDIEKLLRHLLTGPNVPQALFTLVAEAKKNQLRSGKKTTESCLQQLNRLGNRLQNHEIFNLHSELVSLFQSHGTVNFADTASSMSLSGYDIAKFITDFYNVRNRTTIELPEDIVAAIRQPLKEMVDQERERQLKKMR